MKSGLTFFLSLITIYSFGQDNNLSQKFRQKFEADSILANRIAKEKGLRLKFTDSKGTMVEFAGFAASGEMLFNETHNIGAGRTISTNKVWPGGTAGTALTGMVSGVRLGEWDGGAVRIGHQEFGGRVTSGDGATSVSDHSTHVAGTMIGAGITINAKGMAYQASLKSYDWNADDAEMNTAATQEMLISNHSYGNITGWYFDGANWYWYGNVSISATEDYKFGFYDEQAANWDEIAYNNPYYLICKSAGNDRGAFYSGTHYVRDESSNWVSSNDPRNPDGVYDCVSTYGTAKNILTVGAVSKINGNNLNDGWTNVTDVQMSSFSGWGPTDDGRIKPDVVGTGVALYSSTGGSNTSYASLSGTSMATPNVSGSLLLIQQHFKNLKNRFMRAATLKGLAIHTADESGNAGPDYSYGWGLVNTAKAVHHISDSINNPLQEKTLNNNSTYTQTLAAAGGVPLRITICWTDKPGTPAAPSLDPSNPMLVNDLDIRLKRTSDHMIFYPYILDPANPSALATTGDNFRDNTEQIMINLPSPGNYVLTISHKGILFEEEPQDFSLFISGASILSLAPSTDFEVSTTDICQGASLAFTDLTQNSPTNWEWTFEGGNPSSSSQQNPGNIVYNTPGIYTVKLKTSNAIGSDSLIRTGYIHVGTIPASPVITNVSGNTFCEDSSVVLTSSADSANQWYKDDILIPNATEKTYTVTESGTYKVTSTIGGCISDTSAGEIITKIAAPQELTIHGDDSTYFNETELYSVDNTNGSVYEWIVINGHIISGTGTNEIEVGWEEQTNGIVSVQETNASGCKGDITVMNITLSLQSGIGSSHAFSKLNVYPNPAKDLLHVIIETKEQQVIRLSLLNVLGQVLITEQIPAFSGTFNKQLNIEKIKSGIYFLQLEGDGGKETVKLIIK